MSRLAKFMGIWLRESFYPIDSGLPRSKQNLSPDKSAIQGSDAWKVSIGLFRSSLGFGESGQTEQYGPVRS